MAGPQYRLDAEHYIADQLLPEGTIIGDGTPFPFVDPDGKSVPPSRQMTPMNEAGSVELEKMGVRRDPVEVATPIKGGR